MGLFDKLFGTSSDTTGPSLPWQPLRDLQTIGEITERSHEKPQVIFKHSTRCGISRSVINRFESEFELATEAVDLYYLDLIAFRDVSNEVAARFQVWHESPQLLVIKDGVSVHHASHSAIEAVAIEAFVS